MAEENKEAPQTPQPTADRIERAVELGEGVRKGIDVAPEASIPVDAPSAAVVPSEATPASTDSGGGQGSNGASDDR